MRIEDVQLLDEIEVCATAERSATTRKEYRRMQEHFVLFLKAYGETLLTAKRRHVEAFLAHQSGEGSPVVARLVQSCEFCQATGAEPRAYSATYRKRHLAAIKAAYDYLIDEGLVPAGDPTLRVKRPKVTVTPQYRPSVEEVRRLMDHPGTPRGHLAVRVFYYVPARRSEIARWRWSEIDEYGRWSLIGKGQKAHAFKLHPEVLRALRIHRETQRREANRHPAMAQALANPETAWVFMTKRGKQMTGGQLVRILKRHAVNAGVAVIDAPSEQWDTIDGKTSRLSPHAMRRAWATHALNDPDNPVSLTTIQQVLSHANVETTRLHYAATDDGRGDAALLNRRL